MSWLWCVLMVVVFNICGIEASQLSNMHMRPSEQKCQEYIMEINKRQEKRNEQNYKMVMFQPRKNWQIRNKNPRKRIVLGVYDGKQTRNTEYPHMGALGWYSTIKLDWEFLCGASLISSNFVLTAAHCTKISQRYIVDTSEPTIVRLGARNIRKSKYEMYHDYDIDQIKIPQKYSSPNNNYDIALLKLSKDVTFTKFIHPACLDLGKTARNQKYTVTGWGAVGWLLSRAGKMVDDLRFGEVDLIDQRKCDFHIYPHRSRNWNKTSPHQICAGKLDGTVDTCNGDSGGPLQYKLLSTKDEGTMHVIVGITAYGSTRCATKDLPSLYTKVLSFIPWIETIVWPAESRAFFNRYSQKKKISLHQRNHFKNNF